MHHAFSFLISIHLMLLFIRMAAVGGERSIVFQYISCYCLSVGATGITSGYIRFQYISCYCLSCDDAGCVPNLIEFQYISCYCLSDFFHQNYRHNKYFNTSHVTVYLDEIAGQTTVEIFQYISCYCLSMPAF